MNVAAVFHRQTERAFQAEVVQAARVFGWSVWYTHDSRHSPKGWPDLVCIRRPRILFLELKAQRTPVTDDQRDTIAELRACGLDAHIVRPSDWRLIERLLR